MLDSGFVLHASAVLLQMFHGMSLEDLDAFLQKQEQLSAGAEGGEQVHLGSGQQGGGADVQRGEQRHGETFNS